MVISNVQLASLIVTQTLQRRSPVHPLPVADSVDYHGHSHIADQAMWLQAEVPSFNIDGTDDSPPRVSLRLA